MVLTAGDALSELVAAHGLGVAVAPGDVDGIAAGLSTLARPSTAARADFEPVLAGLRWTEVAGPLARWLEHPRPAPDRAVQTVSAGP